MGTIDERQVRYAEAIHEAQSEAGREVTVAEDFTTEALAAMAVADQEHAKLRAERDEARADADEYDGILSRQGDLLTRTANALRGDPPLLTSWSHHDVPELAARLLARTEAAEAELRARELHHFETEQENADLRATVAKARRWIVNCVDPAAVGPDAKREMLAALAVAGRTDGCITRADCPSIEHLPDCPRYGWNRPLVGRTEPVTEPDRPRRYDQCDDTCTTDCGHCKGGGRPAAAADLATAGLNEAQVAAALPGVLALASACPTCSGPTRETVGMVCQTCGTDYGHPHHLARVAESFGSWAWYCACRASGGAHPTEAKARESHQSHATAEETNPSNDSPGWRDYRNWIAAGRPKDWKPGATLEPKP